MRIADSDRNVARDTGSWLDRMAAGMADLPGPSIVAHVVLGVGLYLVLVVVEWFSGGYPVGLFPLGVLPPVILVASWLWLVGRFNDAARRAIGAMRPRLVPDPARLALFERRLTVLPKVPTLLVSLCAAILGAARVLTNEAFVRQVGASTAPPSVVVMAVFFGVFAFVGSGFAVEIIVRARWIHELLTHEITIDLDYVAPLYAFSRLTAAMAIAIVASLVLFFTPATVGSIDPLRVAGGIFALVAAALVFVLPLVGVHGRLVDEKLRVLSVTEAQVRSAADQLHEAITKRETALMDPLQKALAGLEVEHRLVEGKATWPWRPETFRWVVGAIAFPVALYVIQLAIQRLTTP